MAALPEAAALEGVQNQLLAAYVCHCSHGSAEAGDFAVKFGPGHKVDHIDQRVALLQQKQPALPVNLIGVLIRVAVVDVNEGAVPQQNRSGHGSAGLAAGKTDIKGIVAGKGVNGALNFLQRGGGEHCPVTDHAQLQQHKRGKVWVAGLQLGQLLLFCMIHCIAPVVIKARARPEVQRANRSERRYPPSRTVPERPQPGAHRSGTLGTP